MAQTRKILGPYDIVRLRKAGFTVTLTEGANPSGSNLDTITGGTDGLLAKLVHGGRGSVRLLTRLGIRTPVAP